MAGRVPSSRRVRIIATLGPASRDLPTLKRIVREGVTVIRLNFSHGSLAVHEENIQRVRRIEKELGRHIAVLQDLPGPKIRTGPTKDGLPVEAQPGDLITVTTRPVAGQHGLISTSYKALPHDVKRGHTILIDDGRIALEVLSTSSRDVKCKVVYGGQIGTSHSPLFETRAKCSVSVVTYGSAKPIFPSSPRSKGRRRCKTSTVSLMPPTG